MITRGSLLACSISIVTLAYGPTAQAQQNGELDLLIRSHLVARGTAVKIAPHHQLARRYAIDFTGVVPSPADVTTLRGATPLEMLEYFKAKGPMAHSAGQRPYVQINLRKDADHFLFSNSVQFSQVVHIREFRRQLALIYSEGRSYQDFARWALKSQMFLNRFPSGADRANASFFLFIGRDSLASEVASGNMWNGYRLRTPGLPVSAAETDPDYHVYDYEPDRCLDGRALCVAELWSHSGSTPDDVIEMLVGSPMFPQATVDRYWARFIGEPMPGVDFPEIRRMLSQGLVANDFDVNWLIREIVTSAAYTQEAMFR